MEILRISRVVKSGTGLAVFIPAHIARALDVRRGDSVVFSVFDDKQFVVRKISADELRKLKPQDIT